MRASVQVITPEGARQLLESNSGNRTLNKHIIERYRNDMIHGRWRPNGSSISVGPDGRLLNGQHRLSALIEADVAIEFVLVYEDTDDVFSTLDIGITRPTSTILTMSGLHYATAAAAISRQVLSYDAAPESTWGTDTSGGRSAVIEWAQQHAESEDLLNACRAHAEARAGMRSLGAWYGTVAYLVLTRSHHADKWFEFHVAVSSGVGLLAGDARLALRNWVINKGRAPQSEWDRQQALAIGLLAWNLYVSGKTRDFLKFQRSSLPMPPVI